MSQQVVRFIRSRYQAVHNATAPVTYANFLACMRSTQQGAALGYRSAGEGPLFLEKYLDLPVERALGVALGAPVERRRVIEIGSLAANSGLALVSLWLETARELSNQAEFGVAVLTAPLRAMFARLAIPLHVLAPADPHRIGPCSGWWGRYYDNDPCVCAGSLVAGLDQLERFAARRRHAEALA